MRLDNRNVHRAPGPRTKFFERFLLFNKLLCNLHLIYFSISEIIISRMSANLIKSLIYFIVPKNKLVSKKSKVNSHGFV